MLDFIVQLLLSPIDVSRPHSVDFSTAWHGRLMVGAWGILFPVSILITRYMKILPKQRWPQELDNRLWFRVHVTAQLLGGFAMAIAVWLIWSVESKGGFMPWLHQLCGWTIVALYLSQALGGAVRGSTGGPTRPMQNGSIRGDHFDMTRRRVVFEIAHKTMGYVALLLGFVTMFLGMWIANGPVWMWVMLLGWWGLAAIVYYTCQRRGLCLDTYQAIWGPDPSLPGNQRKPIGFGITRHDADA